VRLSRNHEIELSELAAFADGSLGPERRAEMAARVGGAPELLELLAEQERAVALIRQAAAEVEAPAALRARTQGERRPRGARRAAWVGAFATTAVAAALVGVYDSKRSGERLHAALEPTALVPGAGGEATVRKTSSGWLIRLHASGLPRRAGGRFYEAWLGDRDGALVPIGTFNEGTNVTLWAGVSPKSFRILTVTRERNDGEQGASGEKVLAGAITP
jgi:anti-sigma factor RsiW